MIFIFTRNGIKPGMCRPWHGMNSPYHYIGRKDRIHLIRELLVDLFLVIKMEIILTRVHTRISPATPMDAHGSLENLRQACTPSTRARRSSPTSWDRRQATAGRLRGGSCPSRRVPPARDALRSPVRATSRQDSPMLDLHRPSVVATAWIAWITAQRHRSQTSGVEVPRPRHPCRFSRPRSHLNNPGPPGILTALTG